MENEIQKVVFLDRDGVINRDSPDYIKSWSEFEFLPGSLDAMKRLTANRFLTIIITNQSVIHRNLVTAEGLEHIHLMMKKTVQDQGGEIQDIFFCPHIPQDLCACRKPKPGLLFQAQHKYRIDLATAFMVGDSVKDIECARSAGCGHAILVKTGNGLEAEKILNAKQVYPDYLAQDLYDAVEWILARQTST